MLTALIISMAINCGLIMFSIYQDYKKEVLIDDLYLHTLEIDLLNEELKHKDQEILDLDCMLSEIIMDELEELEDEF
jgi:hypothetical protein